MFCHYAPQQRSARKKLMQWPAQRAAIRQMLTQFGVLQRR